METSTIQAKVADFYENEGVVYYNISLFHATNRNSWHVVHRYSEFECLHSELSEKFLDLPSLPSKAFWKKFNPSHLYDRRVQLNEFLRALLTRQDVLQQSEFRQFLQFDENIPNSQIKWAAVALAYPTVLVPISVFPSDNIIFIATNQQKVAQKIEKIRAVILDTQLSTVTCTSRSGQNLWVISITCTVCCMYWSKELTMLSIGLSTGGISTYRVKTEMDYKEYEEFSYLATHAASVVGLCIDYSTSEIFSCGTDKRVVKSNLLHEIVMQEYQLDFVPIAFVADLSKQKIFVLSKTTGVLVIDSNAFVPCMSISGKDMSCLHLGPFDIVLIGHSSGSVTVYRNSVAVNTFLLKSKVLCISYSAVRKEIYVGNAAGFISVWNRAGNLLHMWKAHEKGVVCLENNGNELVSGGVDEVVRVWILPIHWVDPEFEKIEAIEAEIQVKTIQVLTSQKKIIVDDLAGWDKT